jgi:hypothetical protein
MEFVAAVFMGQARAGHLSIFSIKTIKIKISSQTQANKFFSGLTFHFLVPIHQVLRAGPEMLIGSICDVLLDRSRMMIQKLMGLKMF